MTRTLPVCSVMNKRPSGAEEIDVGRSSPVAIIFLENPGGTALAIIGIMHSVMGTANALMCVRNGLWQGEDAFMVFAPGGVNFCGLRCVASVY
jgi:hypothetical protein